MYSFKNRLKICLKFMESGKNIKVKSGHTLTILEGQEEPGFLATQGESEVIFQIGSDVAWMTLIQHAKDMTKEDYLKMVFQIVDIKVPGKYAIR